MQAPLRYQQFAGSNVENGPGEPLKPPGNLSPAYIYDPPAPTEPYYIDHKSLYLAGMAHTGGGGDFKRP